MKYVPNSRAVVLGSYDSATTAWIRNVRSAGGSISSTRARVVNTLIRRLKRDGLFSLLDRLWILGFAGEDTKQAQVDLINLQSWTQIGSGTLGAGGWTGNGTTGLLNSNFNPGDGGTYKFTQNSNHQGLYDRSTGVTSSQTACGNFASATNQAACFCNLNAGGVSPTITHNFYMTSDNDLGVPATTPANESSSNGRFIGTRVGSGGTTADLIIYQNGSSNTGSFAGSTSVAPINANIYLGGANVDGAAANFSTDQYAYFHFGAGLTATQAANMDAALAECMTSLGI